MVVVAEVFRQTLMRIFAPLLGASIAALALLLVFRSCRSGRGGRVAFAQWVAIYAMMAACTLFSGKNTNGVNGAVGPHQMQSATPAIQAVTPEDISNGWRVAEVTAAEPFAMPPSGVVTNERWRLRGAHDDAVRIPADEWSYPFASGVTVLSRGEIRTDIRERDFPRAFEEDLSLLPLANWSLLPEGRQESVFWHAATPSNTLLATWWNAALGRVATNAVNFQAELFPDGGFAYRYEDCAVRHVRLWPFDMDGDGLENSVDPEPLVAGADAHGTNAEWCNVVCSNLFEAAEGGGGAPSWRDGVNSNAYYFVDVVASDGPAPIYFAGDRASRLGNPVVVALGGETNRLPLLMGVEYSVTSTVPFVVSLPATGFASVTTNGASSYEVKWPLSFGILVASGGGYEVEVMPFDPGGDFSWSVEDGGLNLRGGSGCAYSSAGNWIGFSCGAGGNCGCSGCSLAGTYSVECASFALPSLWCGCSQSILTNGEPDVATLSISFNNSAVLFENEYENSPGEWVSRRSTEVMLSIYAYGGTNGAVVTLSASNIDKLLPKASGPVVLPDMITLPPYATYYASYLFEGKKESLDENDVMVEGCIVESGKSMGDNVEAAITVVRIDIQTRRDAPINTCMRRHIHGIGEEFWVYQYPSVPIVYPEGTDVTISDLGAVKRITWGVSNMTHSLTLRIADLRYVPLVNVLVPTGIEGLDAEAKTNGLPAGVAGGLALWQRYRVLPLSVSFEGIAIEEVPCDEVIPPEGYFVYTPTNIFHRTHTRAAGAGRWIGVEAGNYVGNVDTVDKSGYLGPLPRMTENGSITSDPSCGWLGGYLSWKVPFGWQMNPSPSPMSDPIRCFSENARQTLRITAAGDFSIEKLGHMATRKLSGEVMVTNCPPDGGLSN